MTNSAVTDVQWSPNYSSGRPYGDVDSITIHHWGVDGQSHQNVVNYLCREDGNSSAHYVASAGRVTQLVHDYDRAWHAGPGGNPRSIGIECRPEMTDGDVATVIGLIQAIRAEHGPLPIVGHRDWMSTDCPGRWYSHLSELSDGSPPCAGWPSPRGSAPPLP
nr:MAG TPA: N-acetylmuramoyl-L-alanine amidase [Caudoviricetes sp.]